MKLYRLAALLVWSIAFDLSSAPLGTGFTYQGRLSDGAAAANGAYDFRFLLTTAETGGSPIGNAVTNENVAVTNGLFTTILDFGPNVFTGEDRWVEVAVRHGGDPGDFVALQPRQHLLPAPYSLAAVTANGLSSATSVPVEFNIGGQKVFRVELAGASPNVIGGFAGNFASAGVIGATIAGGGQLGESNVVGGEFGTVGGGYWNTAMASGTVAGGNGNSASTEGTVGGGSLNSVAFGGFVGGGSFNRAEGGSSVVCGGYLNWAPGKFSTIGGGVGHELTGAYSAVGGGNHNQAMADFSSIFGGNGNRAMGSHAHVGGGDLNDAAAKFSHVGGGAVNNANGEASTVGGGQSNDANGTRSVVGGGWDNSAWGDYTAVLGGRGNLAYSADSSIGGGKDNFIPPETLGAVIGGGANNFCMGRYSAVPGGESNRVEGAYSLASGRRANAVHPGTFVWADSTDADFASTATNQFAVRASGGIVFYSDPATNIGVALSPGSGTWSSLSDRNAKRNLAPVDGREILRKLSRIQIQTWNYKSQDESVRHIGPTAQDFTSAFAVGDDDRHIAAVDADGVALAAVQGLHEILKEKETEIESLKMRLARLEAMIASETRK